MELTGSNISSYIHPEDQDDLFGLLEIARQEAENPNDQAATGAYTDNIRFFGQQRELKRRLVSSLLAEFPFL